MFPLTTRTLIEIICVAFYQQVCWECDRDVVTVEEQEVSAAGKQVEACAGKQNLSDQLVHLLTLFIRGQAA